MDHQDTAIAAFIAQAKQELRQQANVEKSFARARDLLRYEVDQIVDRAQKTGSCVPEIAYQSIADNNVSSQDLKAIRQHGCVIVRNVFTRQQAESWNQELGTYLEDNHYLDDAREKAGLDNYFGDLKDAKPQIYGVYWSRPQVMARQAQTMAATKQFLNRLWDTTAPAGEEFNPDFDYAYADRTRRRAPGDTTLGLSPHMDAGSYER